MKTNVKIPFRFIGPVEKHEAETISELALDDSSMKTILMDFLTGEIEPRDLAYELQMLFESIEENIKESQAEEKRGA